MKKVLNSFLVLFAFCISFALCGAFAFFDFAKAEGVAVVKLANETDAEKGTTSFADYVNAFSASNVNDQIVLVENIDLNGKTLTNTIGTADALFAGTFNGRGYRISNTTLDVINDMSAEDATIESNQYAAIFGNLNGATIENLSVSGNLTIKTGGCSNLYASGMVAVAQNAAFKNVQVNANINVQSDLACNFVFGGIVGRAVDSSLTNVICRPNSLNTFTFENEDKKIYSVGGIVGDLNNSQILFGVVKVPFNVQVASTFVGDLSFGGIAGKVAQGGSKIINIASENTYNITQNSTSIDASLNIGQIVGLVANPVPSSDKNSRLMSLAYIHYINDATVSLFGDLGEYEFVDETVRDYITAATEVLTGKTYFNNQPWHDLYGAWDFDQTWYIGSSTINLQCFYGSGDFSIKISSASEKIKPKPADQSTLDEKTILTYEFSNGSDGQSYRYGDSASITFTFADGMRDYYNLDALLLNGVEVAQIEANSDGSYRISNSNLYSISTKEMAEEPGAEAVDPNTFTITIKEVNLATAGEYSLEIPEKTFQITLNSRLYKEDGSLVEGELPGYVYYATSTSSETSRLEIVDKTIKYGKTYSFGTTEKNNDPIMFDGWFLVGQDENGAEVLTQLTNSSNKLLSFDFGKDANIKGDCEIFARYSENACQLTFVMTGEGVAKIELFSGDIVVEESGESVNVSKTRDRVKLDLYILDGFEFNVENFLETLNTFKADNVTTQFCEDSNYRSQANGMTQYTFYLNMSALNTTNFEDGFPIEIKTTINETADNSWIWIAVGCGGGALLIIILIIIIVVVKKRRYGGGGGSFKKSSFSKKSMKGMYY